MSEQITVGATSVDKYEKLRDLVNKTNKEKPRPEDLTVCRIVTG